MVVCGVGIDSSACITLLLSKVTTGGETPNLVSEIAVTFLHVPCALLCFRSVRSLLAHKLYAYLSDTTLSDTLERILLFSFSVLLFLIRDSEYIRVL